MIQVVLTSIFFQINAVPSQRHAVAKPRHVRSLCSGPVLGERGAIFGANPEKWDVALTEVERE